MATYVQRAISLITAGKNGDPTTEQLERIAEAYELGYPLIVEQIKFRRPMIGGQADLSPLTGPEKAELLVRAFRQWVAENISTAAIRKGRIAASTIVTDTKDAALADFNEQ